MRSKIFENKNIRVFKKIIIFAIILIVTSFSLAGESKAKDNTKGGKLLNPVADLLVFTGDGIMNIAHTVMYDQTDTTISVDLVSSVVSKILAIAVGVVAAAGAAVLCVVTCGAFAAALASIGVTIATVSAGTVLVVSAGAGICAAVAFNANVLPDVIDIPVYQISPDKIFENKILMFDVDFFNPKEDEPLRDKDGNSVKNSDGSVKYLQSTAKQLRETISSWYTILRDIAVVALLSILVYVGIRILISSTSNDKAKYKQMLIDWVVAICLLFVMQYIMSFANLFVGKVTKLVTSTKKASGYTAFIEDKDGKVSKRLDKLGYSYKKDDVDGKTFITWPTNSLGYARLEAQMAKNDNTSYAGYALIFVVLVLFTVYFIVTYLKRVLYMAFLTLIAPLVAMTYPLDKMNDGKAQAFNMWFREYIFNLLIQPMHLLLYTVLVSSAYELASTNIIYSLVALGFMIPAEKLLRKFFGFEKAQTPGLLAGPAGAALTMSAVNKLFGRPPKPPEKRLSGKNSGGVEEGTKPPRINSQFDKDAALFSNSDDMNEFKQTNQADKQTNQTDKQMNQADKLEDNQNVLSANNDITSANEELQNSNADFPIVGDNFTLQNGIYLPNNVAKEGDSSNNSNNNENLLNNNDDLIDFNGINDNNSQYDRPRGIRRITHAVGNVGKAIPRMVSAGVSGALPAARYYGRGVRRQIKGSIKNMHPIRTATNLVAGAAGAAVAGSIGLAAGITSGDLSKAVQYTGAAAMGGYRMTEGTKKKADVVLTPDGSQDAMERSGFKNDEDYEKLKQDKYIKEYQKNEKNRFELERKYGNKKAKEIMKSDIPQLLNNGVTDMKDITTILDMRDNHQVKDINEGIAVKKYASRIGEDTTKMTSKKKDEWHKTFSSEFNKKDKWKNYSGDKMADSVMNKVDNYNKIKYSK